jgi:hypothetical protein
MKRILLVLIASLFVSGSIFAQHESHWPTIDPHQYSDNTPCFAIIQINGNTIQGTDNYADFEVGAFIDNEFRGSAFMVHHTEFGDLYPSIEFSIQCYGDPSTPADPDDSGKEITFKLFDHSSGDEYVVFTSNPVVLAGYTYVDYDNPVILNFFTTFEKTITAWTETGGYFLIASPIGQVSPTAVTNMIPAEGAANGYDLYSFDQNASDGLEWRNYKNGAFENLEPGKGYLYANSEEVTLVFIGAANNSDGKVTLVKNAELNPNGGFEGWNLVGNPFAQKASFTKEFYTMNAYGSEIIAGKDKVVEAMEGLFVIAGTDGEEMIFTPITENTEGSKGLVFDLKQNSNVVDRAIVRLEGSDNLPKMMLNPSNTKVYIPQADKDYAVMSVNRDMDESMPLNLKVAENGTYTLSVKNEEDNLEYLALLDHKTGMQVNLLLTPNYQFNASTNDAAERFTVFFRSTTGLDEQSNPICFRNNGLLTVSGLDGEYELQVVDVMGRILSNTTAHGEYSHDMNVTPGLYTIRLLAADKTYTKKIVVD